MFVGQIVHYAWRGKCAAALITDFWDDQAAAGLTVFEKGGEKYVHRAEQGKPGEDLTFHSVEECPDVAVATPDATDTSAVNKPVGKATKS